MGRRKTAGQALCLQQLPATSIERLEKLAARAPTSQAASSQRENPSPEASAGSARDRAGGELGQVLLDRYLEHYQVPFTPKEIPATEQKPGRTIYILQNGCLFDPENHRGKDASLIQLTTGPEAGKIYYQCFHDSCHGRRFSGPGGARELISKEDSLAPFMEGYDPARASGSSSPGQTTTGEPKTPPWIEFSAKGKPRFKPAKLANYVEAEFAPLIHELKDSGDLFWRYDEKKGLWKIIDASLIERRMRRLLGDECQSKHISDSLNLLIKQCFLEPEKFEGDPSWVNLKNGMLHLEKGILKPHAKEFYSKVQLPVCYEPKAKCPLWIQTLLDIFEGNANLVLFLQEWTGYCLLPRIIFPAALFQVGGGSNGKGTVEDVLCTMLGPENCCHLSLARMEEDRWAAAELRNKLLNAAAETTTRPLDVEVFKQASAGDRIQGQRKYLPDVTFQPFAKHIFSANSFPKTKDLSEAFFRRVYVLQYRRKFEQGKDEDPDRKAKLKEELDGIFMWAWEGLQRVLARKRFEVPPEVEEMKKTYKEKANNVLLFVAERCSLEPTHSIRPRELYKAYCEWAEAAKINPVGLHRFYENLAINFPQVKKSRGDQDQTENRPNVFKGIDILPEEFPL